MSLFMAISITRDVLYVCRCDGPGGMVQEAHEVLSGEIAEDLYMALAGHSYGEDPGTANYALAFEARQMIRQNSRKFFGEARRQARLAGEVIDKWGEKIVPWLHVAKLGKEGGVIVDAPEYYQEIRPETELAA